MLIRKGNAGINKTAKRKKSKTTFQYYFNDYQKFRRRKFRRQKFRRKKFRRRKFRRRKFRRRKFRRQKFRCRKFRRRLLRSIKRRIFFNLLGIVLLLSLNNYR